MNVGDRVRVFAQHKLVDGKFGTIDEVRNTVVKVRYDTPVELNDSMHPIDYSWFYKEHVQRYGQPGRGEV